MKKDKSEIIKNKCDPENLQNRLKSWPLWVSLASLTAFLIKEIFSLDVTDKINELMNILCPILITFGIVNNPTNKKSF